MSASTRTTKDRYRGKTVFMNAPACFGDDGWLAVSWKCYGTTVIVSTTSFVRYDLRLLDHGYTAGYTQSMKTAISIPDSLFKAADKVARRMGISRSELYQRAIERYLQQQSGDVIREALDVVYGKASNRDLDPLIKAAGEHVLKDENW